MEHYTRLRKKSELADADLSPIWVPFTRERFLSIVGVALSYGGISMPRGLKPGVKLILAKRTIVPWVARNFFNYQLYPDKLNGKRVRVLELPGAEASFGRETVFLEVRTRDFTWVKPAFRTKSVFKILDLQNRVLKSNWLFCERCVQNSGIHMKSEPGTIAGRQTVVFKCKVCQYSWKVVNI